MAISNNFESIIATKLKSDADIATLYKTVKGKPTINADARWMKEVMLRMLEAGYHGDDDLDAKPLPPPIVIRGRVIPRQLPPANPAEAYEKMAAGMVKEHNAQSLIETIENNNLGAPLLRALYEIDERTTVVAAIEAKLEEMGMTVEGDDAADTGT